MSQTDQGRRDDIQGLRAIAVLSVLIFHAFPTILPGGFVGVDIFFVISGYLITGIVYRAAIDGKLSYLDFYRRRIRRIFPALFAMLFPTVIVGALILSPTEYESLAKSAISSIFFVSNIYFWKNIDYFATDAQFTPLLHTWSLGIEEQFYIFLPIIIAILVRFAQRYVALFIALGFMASLVLSEVLIDRSAIASYYLLPTRAFELLVGSFLAVTRLPLPSSETARGALGLGGLLLMAGSFVGISEAARFPGFNALMPTLGTALVLHAGSRGAANYVSHLIANRLFVFFGNISYSLYLWHWPILAYMRIIYGNQLPFPAASMAVLSATFLSVLSYRFVEKPIMKYPTSRAPFLRAGVLSMIIGSLALASIILLNGIPNRFSPESQRLFAAANDFSPERARCHNNGREVMSYSENCIFGDPDSDRLVVVWGDSHATELAWALGEESDEGWAIMQITASNCSPILGYSPPNRPNCATHNQDMLSALVADRRVVAVVMASATTDLRLIGGMEAAVKALRQAGKEVILLTQLPTFSVDPPARLGYASAWGEPLAQFGLPITKYELRNRSWNSGLAGVARRHDAKIVSSVAALCDADFCPMYDEDNGVLYFNKNHISVAGARRIARSVAMHFTEGPAWQ